MPTNSNSSDAVRSRNTTSYEEELYERLLPRDIMSWVKFEAAMPITNQSIYRVFKHYGPQTIEVLRLVQALECKDIYSEDHPYYQSLKGQLK